MVSTHEILRNLVSDLWNKYTRHEFVERLRDGSLPMDVFRYYLIQDTKYVKEMQKAVIKAASKAPLNEAIDVLTAVFSNVERGAEVHERLFRDLSITEDEVNNTGFNLVNYAYTRHLYYYASLGWPQFLAAWAPCMWGYHEIGRYVVGTRNELFNVWAGFYASNEYWSRVEAILRALDKYEVTPDMERAFRDSVNFEIMFWEASLRRDPTVLY
ncbi:TenA family protein [Vulcanisaeta distributa]|uniref:Transcriptional activator, TenA family n=1 Tax=Vulcanisaeta distributa (strain DSM 14429 / JCM 11212 / NBRC 100878 / IC-017) TaxID=572478 RepID=E1QQL5_VULDI|nr:TenA family protein [Vulcanisaeta distributa]ADN50510.1 transcriptional activator, TenA family [Vulcanisaeta distributa DSM 14429]